MLGYVVLLMLMDLSVITISTSKYTKVECMFDLEQRQIDHNGRNILDFLEIID